MPFLTYIYDNKKISRLLIFLVFFTSPALQAKDIIFEGYYKILLGGNHVGFTVQQYSYDQKTKQFHTSYYIKTSVVGGGTTEGLKASANNSFEPISYKYTSQIGKQLGSIDAQFKSLKKNKLQIALTKSNGQKTQQFSKVLPSGTFLASFQTYLMMQKGFKVGTKFHYSAVAEEDGEAYTGQVYVKEKVQYKNQQVYRILNEFKGAKYISLMNEKGEVLKTISPLQNLSTELVGAPAEATKGFKMDIPTLKFLFGQTPRGQKNSLTQNLKQQTPSALPPQAKPHPLQANPPTSPAKKGQ